MNHDGPSTLSDAVSYFAHEQWTAGIIGLGYVGLPLAVTATEAGLPCVAFDTSADVVRRITGGTSHVGDVTGTRLRSALDNGLHVTSDETELKGADALLLCVPSPLGRNRQPDMSYIEAAAETVARVATPRTLVALESTTYPGTTEDIIVPAATSGGRRLDHDVFVAFSPERVDPGNARATGDIPKVVGGVTAASGVVAEAAYGRLVREVHTVSTARTAEMTKLLENTYRAVNIGLINEIAQLAHRLGIDVWEVIEAAATKPFGFQPFYPGPGVGGHCIPLDPQFLAWRAREAKFATRFIDLAEQINTTMPSYTAARIADLLNTAGKPLHGSAILALGVAYKPNVADDRESPAWDVITALQRSGATVSVHDPVVGADTLSARGHTAVDRLDDLTGYDLAVVLTDHEGVDLLHVAQQVPAVFDSRGAFRHRSLDPPNVVTL